MAAPPPKPAGFENLPLFAKVLLLFLIVGVAGAGYYFALHMALTDEIDAAEQHYVQLEADLAEARERKQEFLRLKQELADRESIDRQNKRVLPENAEMAAFLEDLNRRAELSGLKIRLVQPRPEQREQHFTRVPVTLGLSGRYHQLAKFFFHVGRLERAINMENVKLSQPTIEGEDVVLKIDVLATTFRRPVQGGGGARPASAQVGGGGH